MRDGKVVFLSGQRIGPWHLTPISPLVWVLYDPGIDAAVGRLHLDLTEDATRRVWRCAAYRRSWLLPDAPFVAVCPVLRAPRGPYAFAEALSQLRRSLMEAPTHLEVG